MELLVGIVVALVLVALGTWAAVKGWNTQSERRAVAEDDLEEEKESVQAAQAAAQVVSDIPKSPGGVASSWVRSAEAREGEGDPANPVSKAYKGSGSGSG